MKLVAATLLGLALLAASYPVKSQANEIRAEWPPYEEYRIVAPPRLAVITHLGYRELGADIEWARLLVYYGTMVQDHDLIYLTKFLDNIIALDPYFYRVYGWAAQNVTYIRDRATQAEYRMSVYYLHRGLEKFPDRYDLYWQLAIRYYLDLVGDTPEETRQYKELGAHYMERAFRAPDAPPDAATLAANLLTKVGRRDHALRILREQILATDYPQARQKMLDRYWHLSQSEDLTAELETEALSFERAWKASVPYAPRTFHVLLGPPPDPAIDFDELATDRDLFGAEPTAE